MVSGLVADREAHNGIGDTGNANLQQPCAGTGCTPDYGTPHSRKTGASCGSRGTEETAAGLAPGAVRFLHVVAVTETVLKQRLSGCLVGLNPTMALRVFRAQGPLQRTFRSTVAIVRAFGKPGNLKGYES